MLEVSLVLIFLMLWVILTLCGTKLVAEIEWRCTVNGSFLLVVFLIFLDAVICFFIAAFITGLIGRSAGII